jgi:hypothetical protein
VKRATVRILGKTWYDLGSDVNWPDHGGTWGRPAPTESEPGRWAVLRFDPDTSTTHYGYVDTDNVHPSALRGCGVPADGLDEYGDAIPGRELAGLKAAASANWYGLDYSTTQGAALWSRARAARWFE